jgi:hypothetical protein
MLTASATIGLIWAWITLSSGPGFGETPAPILSTLYGNVQILPADNAWNMVISNAPLHPDSDTIISTIGADIPLHPDFGTVWNGAPNGIPYVVVPPDQAKVSIQFQYADESDPGPYPIPPNPPIEGGPDSKGDRHILIIDPVGKTLYEIFSAYHETEGWRAGSGAIFDLASNALRPAGWTSADAAGLPIFPGLARYDEVDAGEIRHALRFTVRKTRRAYISSATHFASRHRDAPLPPMGLRLRLKQTVDLSGFPPQTRVILAALKRYGMILADNGGDWYISGAPNANWDDMDLRSIKQLKGSDLEVIFTGNPVIEQ